MLFAFEKTVRSYVAPQGFRTQISCVFAFANEYF